MFETVKMSAVKRIFHEEYCYANFSDRTRAQTGSEGDALHEAARLLKMPKSCMKNFCCRARVAVG